MGVVAEVLRGEIPNPRSLAQVVAPFLDQFAQLAIPTQLAEGCDEQVQALLLGAELLPCFLPGLMLCLRFDGVAIRSHGANWILGSTAQR